MKLEDQVISLDFAKQFKQLGFNKASCFWWTNQGRRGSPAYFVMHSKKDHSNIDTIYPAYTASELGEMLPNEFSFNTVLFRSLMKDLLSTVSIGFLGKIIMTDNEVNSRAEMLIHLIENGLVKVEDLK